MSDERVYKTVHITGSSKISSEDAVRTAIQKAARTVHNLRWFRVTDTRGHIEGDRIAHWQVTIELGFTLE
ncbi:MAG: dodecin domain-containing protein [Gammaproteobacteria bacterium]|nr:dodecin domain-containing protein [Gammaproteobacteria bacterium]